MKTWADIAAVRSFASLLTFSGLRVAIALPSVWLRPGPLKTAAVNSFRSDYPLCLHLIFPRNLDTSVGHHEVRVRDIEAECVCRFCFDVVDLFLGLLRVTKDRDGHSGCQAPRGFVPVVRRSLRKSLAIVASATHSCATVVRNRCFIFSKILLALNDDVLSRCPYRQKGTIMSQSRGPARFHPLFTTDDVGLRKDASVEHVVKVFLNIGEAVAARWIEMPRGILLLQSVPDQPASGAVYLYDRERRLFFFVDFAEGRDDALTAAEFDQLVAEYDLVWWTANPELLCASATKPGMA